MTSRRKRLRTFAAGAATMAALVVAAPATITTPAHAATGGGHLALNTTSLSFFSQRAGTAGRAFTELEIRNDGDARLQLRAVRLTGDLANEFWFENRCPASLAPAERCTLVLWRAPLGSGPRSARLLVEHDGTNATGDVLVWGPATAGFYVATTVGQVYGYGDGDSSRPATLNPPIKWQTNFPLNSGILDLEATPTGDGVWLVAGDGGIFTFGDAAFFGSTGDLALNKPIVGMAATPTGRGYWLVASDGGIFTFGDAAFFGSTGDLALNKPIVGMASTTSGRGYWLVASDGGIFSFGDATFFGSTGDIRLNRPIVAMARTPKSAGYWLVASDGGIFTFGDAAFHGSNPVPPNTGPGPKHKAVGLAVAPGGTGYWIAYAEALVETFGDVSGTGGAFPRGTLAAVTPTAPVAWWADPKAHAAVRQTLPPRP